MAKRLITIYGVLVATIICANYIGTEAKEIGTNGKSECLRSLNQTLTEIKNKVDDLQTPENKDMLLSIYYTALGNIWDLITITNASKTMIVTTSEKMHNGSIIYCSAEIAKDAASTSSNAFLGIDRYLCSGPTCADQQKAIRECTSSLITLSSEIRETFWDSRKIEPDFQERYKLWSSVFKKIGFEFEPRAYLETKVEDSAETVTTRLGTPIKCSSKFAQELGEFSENAFQQLDAITQRRNSGN